METKIQLCQKLQAIGLSSKEASVYVNLLELNEGICSSIARKASLERSTTYSILEQLSKKGLVSVRKKENSIYYRAVDPKLFLETKLEEHKIKEQSIKDLESSLPTLMNLHSDYTVTPQMEVFRGKDGLIQIMEDTLTTSTELLCWCNVDLAVNGILKEYYPTYVRKKVEKKIWLKGIFLDNKLGNLWKEREDEDLREVHLIPKEEYPFENEINIYDDKIAIISHEDKTGIIIQNRTMANTQRAIFNFAFNKSFT
jgi:sugar-specific transcriptional regulator TrmB